MMSLNEFMNQPVPSSVQEDHMVDSDDDLDDTLGAIFDVSITSIVIQKD